MSEKKVRKKIEKKTDEEKRIEAEKFVYEKANEAEQKEEKKEEEEKPSEKQIQSESKIFRNIILTILLIAVVIGFIVILNNTSKTFTVDGVKYTIVQQGQLTLYNTWIPVTYNGSIRQYNFYLYSDPRTTQKAIPFNGSINIVPHSSIVLNITGNLNCNGDGIIAVANLNTLYGLIGTVTKDSNATCDPLGRYTFINIQNSSEASIQEIGPACYNINVNNCNILASTERYMTQTFATIHNLSKSQ
jgi:hypothetical protein